MKVHKIKLLALNALEIFRHVVNELRRERRLERELRRVGIREFLRLERIRQEADELREANRRGEVKRYSTASEVFYDIL